LRILVVEDHPLNQEVMKDLLAALGSDFEIASDGAAALRALEQNEYSLVLMDCQMPGVDGYEATRRYRRSEREKGSSRVPIIAVTAHALADEREKVLQAGMDDFLTKPVQLAPLSQMVQKWAARTQRLNPSPSAAAPTASAGARGANVPPTAPRPTASNVSDKDVPLLDASTPRSDRMWELFVQHSRDDIEFIQEAAAVEDAESLRLRSHRVKGSAYAFGARPLGDKAAELERLAIAGNLDVEAQVSELVRLFDQTCGLMRSAGTAPGART
jgi:CheY-like chemotaxis protein/HPt (histidine-containing phosphotransfer) domain-containing protein